LKPIRALKGVIPIILHHHENYDGTGYPKGLKKDQIPLCARVMAVVSAFEAMITKRPYRTPKSIDAAIKEIKNGSGTQFDPKVVQAFLDAVDRKDIREMLARERYERQR
jgi:HD-GYP domain-containing protein (c-di-GMP phosphodiesterase class II)